MSKEVIIVLYYSIFMGALLNKARLHFLICHILFIQNGEECSKIAECTYINITPETGMSTPDLLPGAPAHSAVKTHL
jgi:hypothetical protein